MDHVGRVFSGLCACVSVVRERKGGTESVGGGIKSHTVLFL